MNKKGTTADKSPLRKRLIACTKCGHVEFKRTLSETNALVRLVYSMKGKAINETIVVAGNVQFTYRCAKCAAQLINTPKRA